VSQTLCSETTVFRIILQFARRKSQCCHVTQAPFQVLFKQTTSRSVNSSRLEPSLSWTLKKPETSDVTSCSILIQRYLGFWWIAPTRSCYTPNTDRFLYNRSKCSWVNLYVHILRDQQSFLPNRNKFILDRHKPFIIELWGHDTSLSWRLNVGVGNRQTF